MKSNVVIKTSTALLFASLGGSLTACSPHAALHPSQVKTYQPLLSTPYNVPGAAQRGFEQQVYFRHAANRPKAHYVKYAQNGAVPPLRGMQAPRPQHYSRAYPFKHHLDESTAFRPKPYTPAVQKATPSYSPAPQPVPASLPQHKAASYAQEPHDGPSFNGAEDGFSAYEGVSYASDYKVQNGFQKSVSDNTKQFDIPYASSKNEQPVSVQTGTSLDQSLGNALSQSPRLGIEDYKIREAQESLVQAKAQGRFRLKLDGTVGASQNETDFNVINRTDSEFRVPRAASLDLSLPIYQGGRIKAQKDVAKVGIDAAKANYDVVETAVSQETAIAHLNVLRDRKLVEIYARNVNLLQKQATITRELVDAGESTLTDQSLLDARLALISVRFRQAEADLAASESNYKKLTGKKASNLLEVGNIALPSSLAEVKATAAQNNALLLAGRKRAEVAEKNINIAKSFGRPKLSLQGVLRAAEGQSDTIRRNSAAEALLNLSIPILSGGENKSRIRQASLAQSRALLETRALQNNLNERIEQLWAQIKSARLSIEPNLAQQAAGQKAYDAINKQRQAGVATLLDVLTVEQSLLDAEINLVQSENAEQTGRVELLGLMGAL